MRVLPWLVIPMAIYGSSLWASAPSSAWNVSAAQHQGPQSISSTSQSGVDTRQARYQASNTAAPAMSSPAESFKPAANVPPSNPSQASRHLAFANRQPVLRDSTAHPSVSASGFYFFSASVSLVGDRDHDGYYHSFTLGFDADVDSGDALVNASIYIRPSGSSGAWQWLYDTSDFMISGHTSADSYSVDLDLTSGFDPQNYDILVDLYESGHDQIVATISGDTSGALAYIPLEDSASDIVFSSAVHLGAISSSLLIDDDRDGFYSRFRLEFEPYRDFGSSTVYAEIWEREKNGSWHLDHTSSDFVVTIDPIHSRQSLDIDWLSGYPTDYYDIEIDIYDSRTGALMATAANERDALSLLPLESADRDEHHHHGGGSWSGIGLLLFAALALFHKMQLMPVLKRKLQ